MENAHSPEFRLELLQIIKQAQKDHVKKFKAESKTIAKILESQPLSARKGAFQPSGASIQSDGFAQYLFQSLVFLRGTLLYEAFGGQARAAILLGGGHFAALEMATKKQQMTVIVSEADVSVMRTVSI